MGSSLIDEDAVPVMPIKLLGNANFNSWHAMCWAEIERWWPLLAAYYRKPEAFDGRQVVAYNQAFITFMRKNVSEKLCPAVCSPEKYERFEKKNHTPTIRERAECLHYIANLEGLDEETMAKIFSLEKITSFDNVIIQVTKDKKMEASRVLKVLQAWVKTRNALKYVYPQSSYFQTSFPFIHSIDKIDRWVHDLSRKQTSPVSDECLEMEMFTSRLAVLGYLLADTLQARGVKRCRSELDEQPVTKSPDSTEQQKRKKILEVNDSTTHILDFPKDTSQEMVITHGAGIKTEDSTTPETNENEALTDIDFGAPEFRPIELMWSCSDVHVVKNKAVLHNYVEKASLFRTGGHETKTYGHGTLYFYLVNGKLVKLEKVYYGPDFNHNILSSKCARKEGFSPIDRGGELFMDEEFTKKVSKFGPTDFTMVPGTVIMPESRLVQKKTFATDADAYAYYVHCRLGYPSQIQFVFTLQLYPEVHTVPVIFKNSRDCETCSTVTSTLKVSLGGNEAQRPLEIVHVTLRDLPEEGRKILLITDEYSRFTEVFFLQSVDEAPGCVMDFIQRAHRGLSGRPKCRVVRFHNDFSCLNKSLENYCRRRRIGLQLWKGNELEDFVEQLHESLKSKTAVLMAHAEMPSKFWPYALKMAVSYHNSLTSSTMSNEVHLLRWNGYKSSLPPFEVFGCLASASGSDGTTIRGAYLGFAPGFNALVFDSRTEKVVEVEQVELDNYCMYFKHYHPSVLELDQTQLPLITGEIKQELELEEEQELEEELEFVQTHGLRPGEVYLSSLLERAVVGQHA